MFGTIAKNAIENFLYGNTAIRIQIRTIHTNANAQLHDCGLYLTMDAGLALRANDRVQLLEIFYSARKKSESCRRRLLLHQAGGVTLLYLDLLVGSTDAYLQLILSKCLGRNASHLVVHGDLLLNALSDGARRKEPLKGLHQASRDALSGRQDDWHLRVCPIASFPLYKTGITVSVRYQASEGTPPSSYKSALK